MYEIVYDSVKVAVWLQIPLVPPNARVTQWQAVSSTWFSVSSDAVVLLTPRGALFAPSEIGKLGSS